MPRIDPLIVVYQNARKLSKWRSIKWSSNELSVNEILTTGYGKGIIFLRGETKSSGQFVVMIIPKNSPKIENKDSMRSAIAEAGISQGSSLLIITFSETTSPQDKYIDSLKREGISIIVVNYRIFMLESPAHVIVPRHEKISKEELIKNKIHYDILPHIMDNDPQAIWNGISAGDYVKITSYNSASGEQLSFRKCIEYDPVLAAALQDDDFEAEADDVTEPVDI